MKLLCDEDIGTGVPKALYAVDYEARSLFELGWRTFTDKQWLPLAGRGGWLVFSRNKRMLLVPEERAVIIRENLGIVFLTSGNEHVPKVLQLLLTKWDDLELLDRTQQRPFAWFLSPNGRLAPKFRHFQL